jgi:uncharacterized protein YbjT (DUF2867 family)
MTVLVTGASGLVGRALVDELTGRGVPVLAATRNPAAPVPEGVAVVAPGIFDGAETVFLNPRAVPDPVPYLRRARAHGVRKVVVLSAANVDDPLDEQPSRFAGDRNKEAEDAAVTSGLAWVGLRPSTFAANTAGLFGPALRAGDVVRSVYPGFVESPLHERDLAAVAAHALLGDDLDGERLPLTGPEDLSHAAMVSVIGAVLGRSLSYAELAPDDAIRGMTAAGMPAAFVTALIGRYARHLDKPQFPANGTVAAVLGRPALTYAEWVAAHAPLFARRS